MCAVIRFVFVIKKEKLVMLLEIYSLFDSKAAAYQMPMYFHSVSEALRFIQSELRRKPDSMQSLYPADYSVTKLGTFDLQTGIILPEVQPLFLGNLLQLFPEVPPVETRAHEVRSVQQA